MNIIIIYFTSYLLTLCGYLLGRATKEEHKEIKKNVNYATNMIIIVTYISLFYVFRDNLLYILILCAFAILKLILVSYKKHLNNIHNINLNDIHNVGLFAITLTFCYKKFYFDEIYLALLPMLVLILKNSFHEFKIKKEIHKVIIAIIFLIIFYII